MSNEHLVLHSEGGGGGGLNFEEEKGMNAIEGISYFQATKIIKEYF